MLRRPRSAIHVASAAFVVSWTCSGPSPGQRDEAANDTRPPPPGSLLEIMIDLERHMNGIAHGIWWNDYDAIAAAATSIADHPQIPVADRTIVAETLGPEMGAFASLDREVHDAAVRARTAADMEDPSGVLDAWQAIQTRCVDCHLRFRDRLKPVLSGRSETRP